MEASQSATARSTARDACIGLKYSAEEGRAQWIFSGTREERELLVREAELYNNWIALLGDGLAPPSSYDLPPGSSATDACARYVARHRAYHHEFKRPDDRGDYEKIPGFFSVAKRRSEPGCCIEWDDWEDEDSLGKGSREGRRPPGCFAARRVCGGCDRSGAKELCTPADLVSLLTTPVPYMTYCAPGIGYMVLPMTRRLVDRAASLE